MTKKIVTFGEVLMRLTPVDHQKLYHANDCHIYFGGSEANVAAALARYGMKSCFVTKLPNNSFGQAVLNKLAAWRIDTSYICRGGERLGTYLLEKGYMPCADICTYDRNHSSMQTASPKDFNWPQIFKDADWFHISGITPALSPSMYRIVLQACKTAHKLNIPISCDINYRSKLWSKEEAAARMPRICQYADILFINEDEASILGIDATGRDLLQKQTFSEMANTISANFNVTVVSSAARVTIDGNLGIKAMLYDSGNIVQSVFYPLQPIESVGAGDAFAAAVIFGLLTNQAPEQIVNFAAATCALKHSIPGDVNLASFGDTLAFMSHTEATGLAR